jgi:CDP-diacylglycerol--serine O-phosphatidyltransferase
LPVFSGKKIGKRVPPDMVLPIFVVVVLFVALLVSYPWEVLTVGTLVYLAALPFGWVAYRRHRQQDAAAGMSAVAAAAPAETSRESPPAPGLAAGAAEDERPSRLN